MAQQMVAFEQLLREVVMPELTKINARLDNLDSKLAAMGARDDRIEADLRHFYERIGEHSEAIKTLKQKP